MLNDDALMKGRRDPKTGGNGVQSVYLTWMISALALGVLLLPVFKPPWAKLSLPPFVDFFRRYWVHILIVFAIYNAKDVLDQADRLLMASTGLDMTPYIWAIEGNLPFGFNRRLKRTG